jgi:CubicO group peptidase (beta-lactamase class C family)
MSYKSKFNCLKFSSILILLLFVQSSYSQQSFPDVAAAVQAKQALLGQDLVVIITNKDSVVFQKEYGQFNGKTVAPIASCSKWLTAALVMQLVDEGKLSLDDKVTKYLPEFERYNKNYITIRHCLSHFTGIQSEPIKLLTLLQRKKYNSLEEEVNNYAAKEIDANPGTEFRYSEIGLNVAARVIEVITKRKFESIIKQKLLIPLGMIHTTFATIDLTAPNPSGGAKSTAIDYSHFLQMLLNDGMYNGKRILSEAAVKQLKTISTQPQQIKYAPPAAQGFMYASGSWVLEKDKTGTEALSLASPGLFGTWPMVDFCRGYTCIFFVKNLLGEQRADAYMQIKKVIDTHFRPSCY